MGMSQRVECSSGVPTWATVKSRLPGVKVRMIDGQLVLPGEEPPDHWGELRISLDGMMVTLKRDGEAVEVVAWGNADEATQRTWNTVAKAFADGYYLGGK